MAITITIGRDVGQSDSARCESCEGEGRYWDDNGYVTCSNCYGLDAVPMGTGAWVAFRAEIVSIVRQVGLVVYFTGAGEGFSAEWGREDAFTIVASEPQFSDTRKRLYEDLARIARYYGQEAVAVTEGTTEFV